MFEIEHDYTRVDEAEIRFSFVERDINGATINNVERVIRKGEDGFFCLPELLEAFTYFLQSMTFTYVGGVSAFNERGEEVANSDTI